MNLLLKILLATFFIFTPYYSLANDLVELDKTPWGLDRKNTAKNIGINIPPSVGPDSGLTVSGFELNGFDGNMGYVFMKDRLVEVHFEISDKTDPDFSSSKAVHLKKRLEKQFDRHYGDRLVDNQQCDNMLNCDYSVWHKDKNTAVGLFLTDSVAGRNLGVSYMERVAGESDSPFWEPKRGLGILPPDAEDDQGLLFR